jgi:hypothetical protein
MIDKTILHNKVGAHLGESEIIAKTKACGYNLFTTNTFQMDL